MGYLFLKKGQYQSWVKLVDTDGHLMVETERVEKKKPDSSSSSNTTTIADDKLKFLLGSVCFPIGQPIAIECFTADQNNHNSEFTPRWRKIHHMTRNNSTNQAAIWVKPPSTPNVLFISEFKPSDMGVYVCRTKNAQGRVVDVGVEFKKDARNVSLVVVNSMEESGVTNTNDTDKQDDDDDNLDDFEKDEKNDSRLPNIRITFSDKLALARGERVKLVCESGKHNFLLFN